MAASKKLMIGAAALAAVIGLGGFAAYRIMQQRAVAEVEEQFRAFGSAFAKAEHGPIEVDIWNRTLKITNISLQPKDAAADTAILIAGLNAIGTDRGQDGTVAADRLELTGLEATATWSTEIASRVKYEAPAIVLDGFALRPLAPAAATGTIGAAIRLIEATSAKSINVPMLKTTTTLLPQPAPAQNTAALSISGNVEQTQHNVRFETFSAGRIARATADRLVIASKLQPPGAGDFTGEISDLYVTDHDLIAMLSLVDAELAAKTSTGQKMLWQTAGMGRMTIKSGKQLTLSMAGASIDKVSIDTAKAQPAWQAFRANQPKPPGALLPRQQAAFATALADMYESVGAGKLEYLGLGFEIPGLAPVKLDRFTLENYQGGTLGSFVIAGLDGATPQGEKFKLGRFALTGMKVSQMLRLAGQTTPAGASVPQPSPTAWDMLRMLDGVEIEGLDIPDRRSPGQTIVVEALKANWGSFVGQLPAMAQFNLKATGPISPTDPEPFKALAGTGLGRTTIGLDGKWNWQEATQSFGLGPVTVDLAGAGAMTAEAKFENVTRQALMAGPQMLPLMAQDMRLGPVAVSVRDGGLLKLVAANPAMSVQHQQMIQALRATDPAQPADVIELAAIKAGIAKFLETPGGRLDIGLTPKSSVSLSQLLSPGNTAAELGALLASQFNAQVTASPAP